MTSTCSSKPPPPVPEPTDSIQALVALARRTARGTLVGVCWAQWRTLGFMAGGEQGAVGNAFIDPEALLWMTLDAARTEPRLDQALAWWAVVGADLVSVPRLTALRADIPNDLDTALAAFAARAVGAGATSSAWKRLAAGASTPRPERLKGVSDTGTGLSMVERPALMHPAAAMLRLRALAGVGAKADVAAFLAASPSRAASVRTMRKALGYSYVALRRAADDLVAAGVASVSGAQRDGGREPVRYLYRPGTLVLGDVPPWRYWPQIVAFLLHTARWGDGLPVDTSPYLLASQARDLHTLLSAFDAEHAVPTIQMPGQESTVQEPVADPRRFPGEAYLEPFVRSVENVSRWVSLGLHVAPAAPGRVRYVPVEDA